MSPIILATLFATICYINADLDLWEDINRSKSIIVIAASDKVLFAVDAGNHLYIMDSDYGFELFGSLVKDVATNRDHSIWLTRTDNTVVVRAGITSSNVRGTDWVLADGLVRNIATGRYGLVFGVNTYDHVFSLNGLSASTQQGGVWIKQYGSSINKVSCSLKVCFVTNMNKGLFTTGLLPYVNSPMMSSNWIKIDSNPAIDVSAYGTKTLWKIDTNGDTWEAVNVFDSGFLKVNWERRGYGATKFKDIAVTDKQAFALSNDGRIHVRTGCPIFDFEDDDISTWQQTGNAFIDQPVVGERWYGGGNIIGKVGDRMIDTYSRRKNYSIPTGTTLVRDAPTGTLTSPLFQIRTNHLHYSAGGGKHPNNYVSLVVNGNEERFGSGRERIEVEKVMSRFWWDVGSFVNKCARIKVVDLSSGAWSYTMFDDLRGSPPCFKGMTATWTAKNHGKAFAVGTQIIEPVKLEGFSTTKLRMLTITVSFPVVNGVPLVFLEDVNVTWTHCESQHKINIEKLPASSNKPSQVTAKITGLLSDAVLEVIGRVNDHDALQTSLLSSMKMTVNYMDEYIHRATRLINATRHGNETAQLEIKSWIQKNRNYSVGENFTLKVAISHNYTTSLQRAYDVTLKLYVPPYMTFLHAEGLNASRGDTMVVPATSEHVFRIRELLLGNSVTITMDLRIDGDARLSRKTKEMISGDLILDATYCVRNNCRNTNNSEIQVKWLSKNKIFNFWYSYEKKLTADDVFTVIVDKTSSLTFICGSYASIKKQPRPNCYFKNATSEWKSLGAMLSNVSFYDATKGELYGAYSAGGVMKIHGERLTQKQMLSSDQWNSVVAVSSHFAKPVLVVGVKGDSLKFDKNVTMIGADGYKISVSGDGLSSRITDAVSWAANLKWRCCY